MSWFKIDDGFHCHPKILEAGNEAAGFYVRCGSWVSQQLTDGFVPTSIALLYGNRELADRLVSTGLWITADGGWRMHDFLAYNRSREEVLADRAAAADRQKRARERAKAARESKTKTDDRHGVTNGVSHGVSHSEVTPVVTVPPTRPDPTRPVTTSYGDLGGGVPDSNARDDTPPAPRRPRCKRHRGLADDDPGPNCTGCRDARLATENAGTQQAEQQRRTRRAATRARQQCTRCDDSGYLLGTGGHDGPARRCDHRPDLRAVGQ